MEKASIKEVILAHGHENILATHKTTLEITKDTQLSKNGNCIVAVAANKSLNELSDEFRKRLRKKNSKITIIIEANGLFEELTAKGFPKLTLANTKDMVIRKSDYICDRTLAIKASKSACDLSSNLVKKLRDPKEIVRITLIIN
ncbi:MAG: DUF371 domain-containing protein [Candidatus Bathyarchaeota archaeon]|nr:DUF371 domain-containing protein [Candidatus Bathyarchaeota archaeon]